MNNYMKIIISALKQWVNENLAAFDAKILNKVDAVDGKGLSTEDFTTEHKNKLDSITIPLSDSFIPDNIARIDDVNEVKELIGNIEIPEVNYPVTSVNGMTGDVVIEAESGVSSWNDLEDRPFYEETNPVTITWDGNIEGRETVYATGLNASGTFVHVSDITPSVSEMYGATIAAIELSENASGSITIAEDEVDCLIYEHTNAFYEVATLIRFDLSDGNHLSEAINLAVVKVDGANYDGIVFPKAGVYFLKTKDAYITSLSLLKYTEIHKIDEKFIPDSIARMDDLTWGNLGNKPFGEEDVVIEWDGNTDGRESATGTYTWYHVSDNVPTVDELTGGILEAYLRSNSSTTSVGITNRALNASGECIFVDSYIIIAKVDNAVTAESAPYPEVLPKAGIYFMDVPENLYISKLSYNATKTLDEKFIPNTIARAEHTHEDYALKTDILSPKSEFILNSSTEGSTKQFKLTIDDTGTLTIAEIVEEVE